MESERPGQTTTASTFCHEPRAADVPPESQYSNQRRFGADRLSAYSGIATIDSAASVCVFRDGTENHAEVEMSVDTRGAHVKVAAVLSPSALRELARSLIDAAHDIETNPADVPPASSALRAG